MTIGEARKKVITKEEAEKNLIEWLDLAAFNSEYCGYDVLVEKAYDVLGEERYSELWKKHYDQYVCQDGLAYRVR